MTSAQTERPRVGWIGTGRMGYALVTRLLDAGYEAWVHNRTRAKAEPLGASGARIVDRPVDLAGCEVVFVMVTGSADLEAVTTGDDGILTAAAAPKVLVDSSTVSSEVSALVRRAAAKRGTEFLAAPISGNPKVVERGLATMAVSGPRPAFDLVEPVFHVLCPTVTYVGDGELARLAKICHNVLLGVVTQSLAEVVVLAEKGGMRRAALLEFINSSVMGSLFTRYKSPALVNLDFAPTFTMPLLYKDFDLGLATARELDAPMPLASAAAQIVASAIGAGHRDEDFASLIVEQARRAGITLQPEASSVDDGLGGN